VKAGQVQAECRQSAGRVQAANHRNDLFLELVHILVALLTVQLEPFVLVE
jgi:hypothetical protein